MVGTAPQDMDTTTMARPTTAVQTFKRIVDPVEAPKPYRPADRGPFEITSRKIGDVVILDCVGSIYFEKPLKKLVDELDRHNKAGEKKIVLNWAGVKVMDSETMGFLVAYHKDFERGQVAEIVIAGARKEVKRRFEWTHLNTRIKMRSLVANALNAFGADQPVVVDEPNSPADGP